MTDIELLDVFSLFGFGEENAINAKTLKEILGLKSTREVRQIIHRIRERGLTLCSSGAGYYRPATEEELERFVRRMDSQAQKHRTANQRSQAALKQKGC